MAYAPYPRDVGDSSRTYPGARADRVRYPDTEYQGEYPDRGEYTYPSQGHQGARTQAGYLNPAYRDVGRDAADFPVHRATAEYPTSLTRAGYLNPVYRDADGDFDVGPLASVDVARPAQPRSPAAGHPGMSAREYPVTTYPGSRAASRQYPTTMHSGTRTASPEYPATTYPGSRAGSTGYPATIHRDSRAANSEYPATTYPGSRAASTGYPATTYRDSRAANSEYPATTYPGSRAASTGYPATTYPGSHAVNIDYLDNVRTYSASRASNTSHPSATYPSATKGERASGTYSTASTLVASHRPRTGSVVVKQSLSEPVDSTVVAQYIAASIVTMLCFWPVGLAGVISSVLALREAKSGNQEEARRYITLTAILNVIAVICGICIVFILFIIFFS